MLIIALIVFLTSLLIYHVSDKKIRNKISESLLSILCLFINWIGYLFALCYSCFTSSATKEGLFSLPGPPTIPFLGNVYMFHLPVHKWFMKMSKTYGPIYNLKMGSLNWIVISDSKVAKELFLMQGADYSSRPVFATGIYSLGGKTIALCPYGNYLKMTRSLTQQGFRPHIIDTTYFPIIKQTVADLIHKISGYKSAAIIPDDDFAYTVTLTLALVVYGRTSPEHGKILIDEYVKIVDDAVPLISFSSYAADIFPWMRYLPFVQKSEAHAANIRTNVDIASKKLNEDLLKRMKEFGDKENSFAAQIMRYENGMYTIDWHDFNYLFSMLLIGGSSVITTLKWTIGILAKYQDVQQKIQYEIKEIVGEGKIPTLEQLDKLYYMQAVLKEIWRMRPPLYFLLPHSPSKDKVYRGYHIPKDSSLIVDVMSLHYDPSIFPNPEMFIPSRWLNNDGTLKQCDDLNDIWQFGKGRRRCPGDFLAERIINMLLCMLLDSFNVEPEIDVATGKFVDLNLEAYEHGTVMTPREYKVRFIKRNSVILPRDE
ncbi:cytochrome P450 [Gigaspora rosea]|uniref:Cytochrome P450 n=1 Tax=Gigaspora rosea TaxID=44941 RepID=A0A397W8A9_9GLOM|nr:cytochrome P450 [Gigaspora rosea]